MITLRDINIGFGKRTLLNDANVDFTNGIVTALIGRNGSGKSTLLRAMAGLNRHYKGEIYLDGDNVLSLTPAEAARKLAFVNTERTRLSNMRCRDVVAMGRAPYTNWIGKLRHEDMEIVDNALAQVGMTEFADRTLDRMSDGECQRIMIARALAQDTDNILLDEPTSFLDMPNRYELVNLLVELAHRQQKCIIFSTHELDIAVKLCDRIALIDDKHLHSITPEQFIANGYLDRLFSTTNIRNVNFAL